METGQDVNNEVQGSSTILTEDIPKYGTVSLLFFIPEAVKDRDTMVELIKENGGNIVQFHECFTYQLGPPDNAKGYGYYQGPVYSFQWIIESVEQGKLLPKENYMLLNFQSGIDFPFRK